MAIQAVGGWFASAFVDVLLEKFSSSVIDHWISVATEDASNSGLHHDLRRLRTALLKTQAVLIGVESRQINNYSLVALLRELKDAAYDADDLIDEFEYRILQQRVEGRPQKRKFSSFLNIFIFSQDDATTKIREITERLDRACADVGEILKLVDPVGGVKQFEVTERRETSSFLTEPDVLGRDKEIEDVVKLLLLSGDGNQNVSVLPIVGMGGLGKTTLAQHVYNDQRVEYYFQLKMWVYVSANFDVKKLVKEIIESACEASPTNLTNLNKLQVILKDKLMGKRFLLVLDDMWNEERDNWKTLFTPLNFGAPGSMILITTRSQKVAAIVGTMNPVSLEGLAEDSYWSLFKKCAFGDRYSEEHLVLEIIGKKIINKLKGSPLAAKTIGGLLSTNLTEKHWRSIMESDMWYLHQNEDDIFPVLRLSYHYLPAHLKQCFAYCAIFPKGYGFEKDHLVQMWMAHGFIKARGNMQMEDIGSDYFDDLFFRSFFHHSTINWTMPLCVMHDLINDLAQSISVDDCFRIEDDRSRKIPKMVRHLSVCDYNMKTSEVKDLFKFKKLRTLVFYQGYKYKSDFNPDLHELFKELTRIRVISFRSCYWINKLPATISNLKHLRYLNLYGTKIERLPESLCNLYNLQVLNILNCRSLRTLPDGMSNLINLQRLEMNSYSGSLSLRSIGNLNSLQTLEKFKVLKQAGHRIGELKEMNELRGKLCISNLENVENKEDAGEAALNNKKHLGVLELSWTDSGRGENSTQVLEGLQPHPNLKELKLTGYGGSKSPSWLASEATLNNKKHLEVLELCWTNSGRGENNTQVLEGLQPHPNLKELKLTGYGGSKSPSWLEDQWLSKLKAIYLEECPKWEVLPPLGQLSFLKTLHIKKVDGVKQLGEHFYSRTAAMSKVFPSLEDLRFDSMSNWEEWSWSGIEECLLFPCLKSLCIWRCPRLRELPQLPPTLTCCKILDCPNLTSLGEGKPLTHLKSLQNLFIKGCNELLSLTMDDIRDLIYLEVLKVDCLKLESAVPASEEEREFVLLPSSLQLLRLPSGGEIDIWLPRCLPSLTSLSDLEINGCPHITSLPGDVLRHLTALESLTIRDCEEMTLLGGLQALVSLKYLVIEKCPKLIVSREEVEDGDGLKLLRSLTTDNSSLLTGSLLLKFPAIQLGYLTIRNCAWLTCFTDEQEQWLQNLTSLWNLRIIDCVNLESLPVELQALSSLRYLGVGGCPKIQSLPEKGLPMLLEDLHIWDSPILEERCRKEEGPDWIKISHIPHITYEQTDYSNSFPYAF